MRKKVIFPLCVLCALSLLLSACGGGSGRSAAASGDGDTILLRHAGNLTLVEHEGYTVARLRNPWDTAKILHTYVLVDRRLPLPDSLPEGSVVRTPLLKSVVYSSVHCSLLKELGALNSVAGVCDLKYIKLAEVKTGCAEGRIADLGDGMNPDIERLIDLRPDAILLSPFENSGGYGRVEKLEVPIIECADYMENSALGRAEWMRFYGLLFGHRATADSLFAAVESRYEELKRLAAGQSRRPSVMCDLKNNAVWYTPGGRSTIAGIYADAGADYIFADDTHGGSLPYPFEKIFERGEQADFWLIRYNQAADKTYSELSREFSPYAGFKAFKERNIFGCNTHRIPFYEEVPFHPHLLLQNLIGIFHPGLLEGNELRYYTPLKENN